MAVTVSDVQEVFGTSGPTLSSAAQQSLLDIADRLASDVFGGKLARSSELEGDTDDFVTFLAAHLWELAEGGEVASQSQTGGNVNFNHLTTNAESSLGETRFGRLCLLMLREEVSTGIVRGR